MGPTSSGPSGAVRWLRRTRAVCWSRRTKGMPSAAPSAAARCGAPRAAVRSTAGCWVRTSTSRTSRGWPSRRCAARRGAAATISSPASKRWRRPRARQAKGSQRRPPLRSATLRARWTTRVVSSPTSLAWAEARRRSRRRRRRSTKGRRSPMEPSTPRPRWSCRRTCAATWCVTRSPAQPRQASSPRCTSACLMVSSAPPAVAIILAWRRARRWRRRRHRLRWMQRLPKCRPFPAARRRGRPRRRRRWRPRRRRRRR
mmetsp:Transcript_7655/g.18127  ORF Transcript_7655/g.18127 Transcript_7655/m.18127 type:complete len:257 (-) Transcript_7655:403-1173(-)